MKLQDAKEQYIKKKLEIQLKKILKEYNKTGKLSMRELNEGEYIDIAQRAHNESLPRKNSLN